MKGGKFGLMSANQRFEGLAGASRLSRLYKSLSLAAEQIRVLDIDGIDPINVAAINGRLRIVDLRDRPVYTALSYVWGQSPSDQSEEYTICCNDQNIAVTRNCWRALRQLRKNFGHLTIWIDAICINQEDESEKIRQLELMGSIYSLASTTYIWLGEGTPKSDQAMVYLQHAGYQDYMKPCQGHCGHCYVQPRWPMMARIALMKALLWPFQDIVLQIKRKGWRAVLPSLLIAPLAFFEIPPFINPKRLLEPPMKSIAEVLNRKWNSRMWTLQEVLLSPNPTFCCGEKILPWRNFIHGVAYVYYYFPQFAREQGLELNSPSSANLRWRGIIALWIELNIAPPKTPQATRTTLESSGSWAKDTENYASFAENVWRMFKWLRLLKSAMWTLAVYLMSIYVVSDLVDDGDPRETRPSSYVSTTALYVWMMWGIFLRLSYGYRKTVANNNGWGGIGGYPTETLALRYQVVDEIISRQCIDQRDMSYSIRAVLARLGIELRPPDPTRSQGEIYKKLFVNLLGWTDSLRLLVFCGVPRSPGLPSWVPNFGEMKGRWITPGLRHGRMMTPKLNNPFQKSNYWPTATNDSKPKWAVGGDGAKLIVRGRILGKIAGTNEALQRTKATYDDSEVDLHKSNVLALCEIYYQCRKQTPFYAVNRERNTDMFADDMRWQPSTTWRDLFLHWKPMDKSDMIINRLRKHPSLMRTHLTVCNDIAAKSRCLFFTFGPLASVGNGPPDTQVCDDVVLLSGFAAPVILREQGTAYILVGYALLDNERVMDGGWWQAHVGADDDIAAGTDDGLQEFVLV